MPFPLMPATPDQRKISESRIAPNPWGTTLALRPTNWAPVMANWVGDGRPACLLRRRVLNAKRNEGNRPDGDPSRCFAGPGPTGLGGTSRATAGQHGRSLARRDGHGAQPGQRRLSAVPVDDGRRLFHDWADPGHLRADHRDVGLPEVLT